MERIMKNMPELRFEGFNEAWEQRKLGDILQTLPFKPYLKEIAEQDGVYEIIQQGNKPIVGYANGNPCLNFEDTVIFGDHTLSLYKPNSPFFVATDGVRILKGKEYIQGYYLLSLLERYKPQSEGYKRYYSILSDKECYLTKTVEEQQKIGKVFESVDNLLTLHQRKYEELKITKAALLQKMFPKEGETVPELRFEGFTGAWEQRALGEVFEEYSEKNHESLSPLMVIQGGGTLRRDESDRALQYDKSNLCNYKLAKKSDFILHLRSFEGGLEIVNCDGIVSPAYHLFHGNAVNATFYYSFFRSKEFIDVLLKPHVFGIRDGKSIDINGMKTIKIPYPSLAEQNKIGEVLDSLNNLIKLHQHKCEQLKTIKSALLQKMFV